MSGLLAAFNARLSRVCIALCRELWGFAWRIGQREVDVRDDRPTLPEHKCADPEPVSQPKPPPLKCHRCSAEGEFYEAPREAVIDGRVVARVNCWEPPAAWEGIALGEVTSAWRYVHPAEPDEAATLRALLCPLCSAQVRGDILAALTPVTIGTA